MKNNQINAGLEWFAHCVIRMDVFQTQGKRKFRNFEGGDSSTNPCIDPSHPNYSNPPVLARCFRSGPS